MSFFLGIDPGKTGAAAAISEQFILLHDWHSPARAREWLLTVIKKGPVLMAVIEDNDQRQLPKKGRYGAYDLGFTTGAWIGILVSNDIPHRMIKAIDWQRAMIGPEIIAPTAKKRSILAARRLDECLVNAIGRVKDHNRADALNMAFYAEMVHRNESRVTQCEK